MQAAAENSDIHEDVKRFLTGFTAETTPGSAAKIADYREHLRENTVVYITFLPGSDFNDTIEVAKRLRREGLTPVPHFAARSVPDTRFLKDNLSRLVGEAGIDQVLIIGGAVDSPVGEFPDSMTLLETGLFDAHNIQRIGVAGHPEGSPDMSDEAIRDALKWKNSFSERTDADLYVVTQFCFEAAPIIEWDKRIQSEGNRLPVMIGVPGLATLKALLGHAKACGVGPSMRFLTRQARNVAKLLTVSTPDELVVELARYQASDPECGIQGVHMYPLGGLRRSAAWSYAVCDGQFTMNDAGTGFKVDVEI